MGATLDQLAERLGIAASYRDQEGQTQTVPAATKSALIGLRVAISLSAKTAL